MYCICTLTQGENRRTHTIIVCTLINSVLLPLPNYYPEDRVRRDGTIALRVGTRFKIFILTQGRHTRRFTEITFNTRTAEDPRTTHTLSFTANTKSSLLLMSRADAWLRAASTGHCGATSDVGDCNTGTRGSMGYHQQKPATGRLLSPRAFTAVIAVHAATSLPYHYITKIALGIIVAKRLSTTSTR